MSEPNPDRVQAMTPEDTDEAALHTALADLQGASLADLARLREELQPYRDAALRQVARPRTNLGSGPPGRSD